MTIHRITTVERFIGGSTDSKPDAGYPGSTFYEVDTGQSYIWDGSNWVEDLSLVYAFIQALELTGG